MPDFEQIIDAEKQRHYKMDEPDLLVFATLTQIAHEEAQTRNKRRFKLAIVICVIASITVIQLAGLSTQSFHDLTQTLHVLAQQKPHVFAIANLGLVGLVLLVRKLRII